ncbi:BON domain-containing protein [Chitinimonas viridis]|uniref:BON domain-containing protein n=1 Tax=Chitinimonas viridis TaxID=664880 RepID=A0ABT8B1G0_9NEIS|nr:BON domain-containing protein [Chitinimonas viridis]MDN3575506.1 BON domain-containing protein [Chitinimonas viridis]
MYKLKPKNLLLSCVLLATGGIVSADTVAQNVIDARQETQIWTTYALSPYLRAHDLKVAVQAGKATLTGKVADDVNKDLAQEIALGVTGIKEVDNQIVVLSEYVAPASPADRSYGDRIDDATISTTIKSKLAWSKHTSGVATEVDSTRGKVTLKGTTDSAAAKELAGRLAMNTRGVVSVNNQLAVTPGKPGMVDATQSAMAGAGRDVADSWITTKVKSTLLYSSNVTGSDIKVSTKGGNVTLSGKLASGAERALAIELAKNVRGVRQVNSKALTF